MTESRTLLPDEIREAHTMRRRLVSFLKIGATLRVPPTTIRELFERHDPAVEAVIHHLRQGRSRAQIAKLYHVHARVITELMAGQPTAIWQLAERNAQRLKMEGTEKSVGAHAKQETSAHLVNWNIGARHHAAYRQALDSELAVIRRYRPDLIGTLSGGRHA